MMTTDNKPRFIARARVGNPPVKDRITSAIISLLNSLVGSEDSQNWSTRGVTWRDMRLRRCSLRYNGRRCLYRVTNHHGSDISPYSGIPPGPAADVFNEYCASLLDALVNQRQVLVSRSLNILFAGIMWQTVEGDWLCVELRSGGRLAAGTNPRPLPPSTRGLSTYSVWD